MCLWFLINSVWTLLNSVINAKTGQDLGRSVVIIVAPQLRSTKSELRLFAGSNLTRGVLEIYNGENLWQWFRLEIRGKRLSLVSHSTKTIHHPHHHHHHHHILHYNALICGWYYLCRLLCNFWHFFIFNCFKICSIFLFVLTFIFKISSSLITH